ncbi:MAG: YfhO family protein [bacterium]
MQDGRVVKPLSSADWLRALPWLLGILLLYLVPYMIGPGGLAAKYVWDEFCVSHLYPMTWFARQEFAAGFFPLWSPFTGGGIPVLANTMEEAVHPFSVFKYILPFPAGLNLYYSLRLFICLTGCYALARQLRASRPGAILGAALFTFTGFVAMNANAAIGSIAYMGWVLFAFHRLAMKPCFSSWCMVAISFALAFLGGNPQYGVYELILGAGLYFTVLLFYKPGFPGMRYVLLPATALAAGAMLTVFQTLPFFEYLTRAFTHHMPGYGSLHLDPGGYVGALSPLFDRAIVFMAGPEAGLSLEKFIEFRYLSDSYANTTVPFPFEYLGVVSVFFLVLSLLALRRLPVEVSFFALVSIISLGTAFGVFPFSLLGKVPPFTVFTSFRYSCFTASIGAAMIAAVSLSRIRLPSFKKSVLSSIVLLGIVAAAGMAVLASRAGLPLSSPLLAYPAAALVFTVVVLALLLRWRRPWPIVIFAVFELIAYDQLMNEPLFPHPLEARQTKTVASCSNTDPSCRFLAYDDVIQPNMGVFQRRHDLRNYDMTFPAVHARWMKAVNNWEEIDVLTYFLHHYYLAPKPSRLDSPLIDKASVRYLLSTRRFPEPGFHREHVEIIRSISPAPEFFNKSSTTISGKTKDGWFQHAPSAVYIAPVSPQPEAKALHVSLSMAKTAWEADSGDGVFMTLLEPAESGGETSLLYSRYLDPADRPGERRWIEASLPAFPREGVAALVLPGPAGDMRSDFAVWGDFHSPGLRKEFENKWKPTREKKIKCYENREARPRLRLAEKVEVLPGLEECYRRLEKHPVAETVSDESGGSWPSGTGEVLKTDWGTNRVEAAVHAESPATLVLADIYYPGWRAWVDGEETRVHRADCTFRAVRVPEGKSKVVFKFISRTFRICLWSGIFSWLFFTAAVVAVAIKRDRNQHAGRLE